MTRIYFKIGSTHLHDQETSDAFREPAFLAGQDHLQHVSVELLHDDENVPRRFEHPFQQNHAGVGQILGKTWKSVRRQRKQHDERCRERSANTCRMDTSFLSCRSCLVAKRVLSMTLMATD